jgi:predicted transcriptional regulator
MTHRIRLKDTIKKKRGRKRVIDKGIDLSMMETALRSTNGLVTKAAKMLGVPIPTLQHYIRKFTTLRTAMFESRSEIVDEAEESLRELVKSKNLTAVIFTLKCLAQDRGYVDSVQKDGNKQAPIVINLMPASSNVKIPIAEIIKGKSKSIVNSEQRTRLALNKHEEEDEESRTIEIENEIG